MAAKRRQGGKAKGAQRAPAPMKVTAGRFRGRVIEAPAGEQTRPVLTRVRQSLFDALAPWVQGGAVLDLFAGSGGFVFEALSRGATHGTAIDLSPHATRAIRANQRSLGVTDAELTLIEGDALVELERLSAAGRRYDLVLCCPPYWIGLQKRALAALDVHPLLAPEGVLIMQRDKKEQDCEPALGSLAKKREQVRGNTVLAWFQAADAPSDRE